MSKTDVKKISLALDLLLYFVPNKTLLSKNDIEVKKKTKSNNHIKGYETACS